ncbi:vanadium-dependent haloperoxidase [Cyclobacterium marinum]|uniref:vanadium-dependent haloperoxidase n=1 Tax=Cyclobacterium marinum TaxID=104 RepID=UPI0011EF479B|nr:vanadium-dependent haloperoxidase [Cyclobacterium marinum]MBI0399648.1 vanadium-dependent haloperoxidase [Cyclobacterium marinum]
MLSKKLKLLFNPYLLGIGLLLSLGSCGENNQYKQLLADNYYLIEANESLTETLVHDIFSPPVASRIYAYPSIASYEIVALSAPDNYASLMGQLNKSKPLSVDPSAYPKANYQLASLAAYYKVALQLIFTEQFLIENRDNLFEKIQSAGMPDEEFEASIALGDAVAEEILAYASEDNYHQSRSFGKYTPTEDLGSWKPTPPAYIEAIEPHWNKIRPFFLDSASQFAPEPPPAFDTIPESTFYQDAKAVMDARINIDDEQEEIAFFWDCNPYKMNVKGHVMYAEKKITPGGHWMGIAGIAAKTKKLDWKATSETMATTAIYLFDGFISCWDEKYRSVLIRPETYINIYMDKNWLPLLQTPPFPEYTSGHSVVSTAAAEALTKLLGEPFHFVDSTEVKFGLGVREFDSFRIASSEAAISRFFGGIHYLPAIDNGVEQGKGIANLINQKIKTRIE